MSYISFAICRGVLTPLMRLESLLEACYYMGGCVSKCKAAKKAKEDHVDGKRGQPNLKRNLTKKLEILS